MNKDNLYLHCYIYCGNYYWLSAIMAYVRKCHTSQKLKYLVLYICLCLAHIACAIYCYKVYWKEKNNKKGLRKKEESVCGGFIDSSENTENIINTTQYVYNDWALWKRPAFKFWKIKWLNWNNLLKKKNNKKYQFLK